MNGYYSIGETDYDPSGQSKKVMGPFGPELMDLGGLGDEPSYYKLGYGSDKGSTLKMVLGIALVGGLGYVFAKKGGLI